MSEGKPDCTDTPAAPLAWAPRPLGSKKKKTKADRAFVFENYPRRKIALRLAYHGHVHDGLAKQDETENTVEGIVVSALKRVRLIPESGPDSFSRCGRTDKGVSALGNAFCFVARASSWPTDEPQKPPLDYCHMLNGTLPPTIRVVGFALVPDDFDARFSCVSRTYRYYFCHRGLHLAAMQEAARFMLGTHSFRNLCKLDVVNVSNFERHVTSVGIYPSDMLPEMVSYFEIQANSFLYHQIRCTMEVLFLVGRGLEKPAIVQTLLTRGDEKPQYPLADGTPLILWDCGFTGDLHWRMSHRAFHTIERELQDIFTALLIRATASQAMRRQLFHWYRDAVDVCVDGDASTGAAPPRVVLRRPRTTDADEDGRGDDSVVDVWSITGSDWTEPRTHENLKMRKYDLFDALRHEDELHSAAPTSSAAGGGAVFVPRGYVPLLERETERSYTTQVAELGAKKRARYEVNEEKKAAGAARIAAQRAGKELESGMRNREDE